MTIDTTLPSELGSLPRDENGPVFGEPWQAQAFAMAVTLNAHGHFTWGEWAERLGEELKTQDPGRPTDSTYYHAWLSALEALIAEKGLVGSGELASRKQAWDRAARATPHGEPIVLGRDHRRHGGGGVE